MKLGLLDIERNLLEVFSELEENGGEVTEEIAEALAVNESDFDYRIDTYNVVIKSNKLEIDRLKEMQKTIKLRIEAKQKTEEYLKSLIIPFVQRLGVSKLNKTGISYKVELDSFKLSSTPSLSVLIEDEKDIPVEYKKATLELPLKDVPEALKDRIKITSIDKVTIKEKLKHEEDVKGASLHKKYGLRITEKLM